MDVTPRELRDIDLREAWRGYNREDVDDLLERAAATIDGLTAKLQGFAARIEAAEQHVARDRESEDVLQRTLLLAQRTADEAVAEAQGTAHQLVTEAEARAHGIVTEAEANARRVAEMERHRLETEVLDLGAKREALLADVEDLERFDAEYRSRLRQAIEHDLDALVGRPTFSPTRPTLHEVELPTPAPEPVPERRLEVPRALLADAGGPPDPPPPPIPTPPVESRAVGTVELGASRRADEPAVPLPGDESPGSGGQEVAPAAPVGIVPESPARPSVTPPSPAPASSERRGGLFDDGDDEIEPEVLDDDAFFASLREAVRDDRPLDPPGQREQPEREFFDQDSDTGRFGTVFKRRR